MPATNSATTAPISASPLEMRKPAEEIGQRARDAQPPQRLQPARPVHAEQADEAGVDAAQAERGVGDDRKQRHDRGADASGRPACSSPG